MIQAIQAMNFSRGELLNVFGIDGNTWNQRIYRGEVTLGFGLTKSLFMNRYGEHDLLAVALTLLISYHAHLDLKQAAELVRDNWRDTLVNVAIAERQTPDENIQSRCFVIATGADKKIKVEVGPCDEIVDKMIGEGLAPTILPLDLVVTDLRTDAAEGGLDLPDYLTPGLPTSAAFKKWMAEIDRYREIADMKEGGRKPKLKKKAKVTA